MLSILPACPGPDAQILVREHGDLALPRGTRQPERLYGCPNPMLCSGRRMIGGWAMPTVEPAWVVRTRDSVKGPCTWLLRVLSPSAHRTTETERTGRGPGPSRRGPRLGSCLRSAPRASCLVFWPTLSEPLQAIQDRRCGCRPGLQRSSSPKTPAS